MPGIFGTQGGRPQRRRRRWSPRLEPGPACSKAAARSRPLSACRDPAREAEKSVWPLRFDRAREQKLRLNQLHSLALSVLAVAARSVLRRAAVVAPATSQRLSAPEPVAFAFRFAVLLPSRTAPQHPARGPR